MVGGGVEAASEGDEFTGMLHAHEHFATSFVVVAGSGQDVFDVTGIGTFVQKLEDGTAVWGADGAGAEALECGEIGSREPGKKRLVALGGSDGVGEGGWCGTQGVFGCE